MPIGRGVKSVVKYSIKRLNKKPSKHGKWSWQRAWLDLTLKLEQNRRAIMVCLAFLATGVAYYAWAEPSADTDLSSLYQLTLPIFLEVVVFGFLAAAMLDRYNPVVTSRLIAAQQRSHTLVVCYSHLGQRIVEHLRRHNKPYVVVDDRADAVETLLNDGEPVVVGASAEGPVLLQAQAQHCVEAFVLENDLQRAIVACFHIREYNPTCRIYVQVFDTFHFESYFTQEPFNALTFSSSAWAVLSLAQWQLRRSQQVGEEASAALIGSGEQAAHYDEDHENDPAPLSTEPQQPPPPSPTLLSGADAQRVPPPLPRCKTSLVVGSGHCALRFVNYIALQTTSRVIAFDDGIVDNFLAMATDELPRPAHLRPAFSHISAMSRQPDGRDIAEAFAHSPSATVRDLAEPLRVGKVVLVDRASVRLDSLVSAGVELADIRRVYICWGVAERFPDALQLVMTIRQRLPNVPVYVRMYDEELAGIVEQLGATVFSTSLYAFKMLKKAVPSSSGLYEPPSETDSRRGSAATALEDEAPFARRKAD